MNMIIRKIVRNEEANFSAIEKNRRDVGPRVALKLAAFMGLSPDVRL